jgi:hypothetical protein
VEKARGEVAALEKQIKELKKKKPKDLAGADKAASGEDRCDQEPSTPHYNMLMANAVEEAALFVVNKEKEHGTKLDYKMGMARDLELMKRGNPNDLGDAVPRRFLCPPFPSKSGLPRQFTTGSGRLELAQAIVEDAAPLTARVIVNRVWKHHFGRGLVDTPSEFGNLGELPTHPELLDDLAGRFMEHGWSIKWLHREILNSATWQQSSVAAESERRDPENKLYARMLRRRLDWESWRDAILTATGRSISRWAARPQRSAMPRTLRRSLYGASDRQDMDPMLRIHDVPDPGAHNPWRTETITPLQGLFALNSPFMQQQADALGRWAMEHDVDAVYARLFGRKPSAHEAEDRPRLRQWSRDEDRCVRGLAGVERDVVSAPMTVAFALPASKVTCCRGDDLGTGPAGGWSNTLGIDDATPQDARPRAHSSSCSAARSWRRGSGSAWRP